MKIEKKYFTQKQIEIIESMKKGTWYSSYDFMDEFGIKNAIQSLLGLFRSRVVDLEEERTEKFFSRNIHYKFKLKDKFELVENNPPKRKI